MDPQGVVSAFGLAEAASDERPIGDALLASDRHEVYLADKGFTGGVELGTTLVGGLRGSGGRYPEEQLPQSMLESGAPLGLWQVTDHRGGDLSTQGLLRTGGPSCEEAGRPFKAFGG